MSNQRWPVLLKLDALGISSRTYENDIVGLTARNYVHVLILGIQVFTNHQIGV